MNIIIIYYICHISNECFVIFMLLLLSMFDRDVIPHCLRISTFEWTGNRRGVSNIGRKLVIYAIGKSYESGNYSSMVPSYSAVMPQVSYF
jgi:hypothetical protein